MTTAHDPDLIERLCEAQHAAYEDAATREGWATQKASRVPWEQVPEANKATMRASILAVLNLLAREGMMCYPGQVADLEDRLLAARIAGVATTWTGSSEGLDRAIGRLRGHH